MQLSTRGRYAVMAMADLASRQACTPAPVTLAQIAASQQLSQCYLEQLFAQMRRAGVVESVRGPGGGYRLAQPASRISIADIVCAVDEKLHTTRCVAGGPGCAADPAGEPRQCQTHVLWHELGRQIHLFLSGVTLGDVVCGRLAGRACCPLPADARAGHAEATPEAVT